GKFSGKKREVHASARNSTRWFKRSGRTPLTRPQSPQKLRVNAAFRTLDACAPSACVSLIQRQILLPICALLPRQSLAQLLLGQCPVLEPALGKDGHVETGNCFDAA